jgi:hypothetical protein
MAAGVASAAPLIASAVLGVRVVPRIPDVASPVTRLVSMKLSECTLSPVR